MESKQELQEHALAVSENKEDTKVVSITQAAKLNNVTRQAIYVAIKQNKLSAIKKTRWEINVRALEEYKLNKYSRKKSLFEGEPLFDNEKGFFSINQVAEILKVPAQKIYYATRTGSIKGLRKGAAWIIHKNDVEKYRQEKLSQSATESSVEIQENTVSEIVS